MGMQVIRYCAAMLAWATSVPVLACSPPPHLAQAGFSRHEVGHLPKNARGVIFTPEDSVPGPGDFRVDSTQDRRPLALRVHPLPSRGMVRLELAQGFQPGAQYAFRYLPAHGRWRYPDVMRVTIDDTAVSTGGSYAIEPAPRPAHRVVLVPSSSGSCVAPAPAVVQAFTYAVPSSLARYRDAVDYEASVTMRLRSATSRPPSADPWWPGTPALYDTRDFSLGMGLAKAYTARKNAVIAACGRRWPNVRLSGAVSFPEVDDLVHRTPAVEIDLNRNVDGQCGELEALLQTVDRQAPEPVLREVCRSYIDMPFALGERALRKVELDQWQRNLELFNAMSSTCNLVALAHLWHTRQLDTSPHTLARLGTALQSGLQHATPEQRDAAVHALAYLVEQLPNDTRSDTARQLLAPAQPALVDALTAPKATRLDELADLLVRSGTLAPQARQALHKASTAKTAGAARARRILAAMPG